MPQTRSQLEIITKIQNYFTINAVASLKEPQNYIYSKITPEIVKINRKLKTTTKTN